MKVKLLRKLRSKYRIVYFPKTLCLGGYWAVQHNYYEDSWTDSGSDTYYTFKDALRAYNNKVHFWMCKEIQKLRSKIVYQ